MRPHFVLPAVVGGFAQKLFIRSASLRFVFAPDDCHFVCGSVVVFCFVLFVLLI